MMGLALWHFTIWLPDRFWGGIVGALIGALIGAALFGWIINGFSVPARHDTHLGTALEAIPGDADRPRGRSGSRASGASARPAIEPETGLSRPGPARVVPRNDLFQFCDVALTA